MSATLSGALFTEVLGACADVVLLHGWGMHGGVLRRFAGHLAVQFRVTLVDLPGHGCSGLIADLTLPGVAEAVLAQVPERAHWVGWSLGAAIALQVAVAAPSRACTVSLLAGSPRFVAGNAWSGMDIELLVRFARELDENYQETLHRFLALQVFGLDNARELLKGLRRLLAEREPPRPAALAAGLGILESADLREAFGRLQMPMLAILGRRDRLVPVAAGEAMRRLNAGLEVCVLPQATHMPFYTHADETLRALRPFLDHRHA